MNERLGDLIATPSPASVGSEETSMGVPGLWDILRPAGKQKSLAQLAVYDGFERNPGGRRGLRVGIDASIWFFHATYGREGENPELRTLFFRCARLMGRSFLPLFVFDGPDRPERKRKKKVSGKEHWMVSGMQEIIEAFGFEWWCAPGEAEAELAYLNRIGVIDAIITDDVDTFLFGATTIIRNPGKMLTGNLAHPVKNAADKDDGEHTYTYTYSDVQEHPEVSLSQGGMILIALLRGGDYDPDGIGGCGTTVAHGLAKCGFGEMLLNATRNLSPARLCTFLDGWRNELRAELRSNSRGFLNTKRQKLARDLPDTFPDVDVLHLYTHPVTSERKDIRPEFLWDREPDLMKLAALCERKFEWGVREIIVKRFRTVMWAPIVLRIMRRAVLDADAVGPSTPKKKKKRPIGKDDVSPGTPSKMITERFSTLSTRDEDENERLIVGIHGKRQHVSTDGMPEYRLEIAPAQLVRLTEAGVQGHRVPPSQYRDDSDGEFEYGEDDEDEEGNTRRKGKKAGPKKPPPDPDSHLRIWMPTCIVERVEPGMVSAYEGRVAQKERDKEEKAARKAARAAGIASPKKKTSNKAGVSATRSRKAAAKRIEHEEEEEEELSADEDFSRVFGLSSKVKGRATVTSKPKNRTRTRLGPSVHEEEEEEEEEEETSPLRRNLASKFSSFPEATNDSPAHRPRLVKPVSNSSKAQISPPRPSTTQLVRQKTILDLLDERYFATRDVVAASSELVASPVKDELEDMRPVVPRPFPLKREDRKETTTLVSDSAVGVVGTGKSSIHGRQLSGIKSDSDGSPSVSISISIPGLASPKKSPRKSREHTSHSHSSRSDSGYVNPGRVVDAAELLRRAVTITDSEDEGVECDADGAGRSVSPSPMPMRSKGDSTARSVSSAGKLSGAGASVRGRRGKVSSDILSSVSTSLKKKSGTGSILSASQPKSRPMEIIEITSGSEAEAEAEDGKKKKKKEVPSATTRTPPLRTSKCRVSKSPVQTQRRVDAIFPVTKPILLTSGAATGLSSKKKKKRTSSTTRKKKNLLPPMYDPDDVIEIL